MINLNKDIIQVNNSLENLFTNINNYFIYPLCDKYSLDFSCGSNDFSWVFYSTFNIPCQTYDFYYNNTHAKNMQIISVKDNAKFIEIKKVLQTPIGVFTLGCNLKDYSPILKLQS